MFSPYVSASLIFLGFTPPVPSWWGATLYCSHDSWGVSSYVGAARMTSRWQYCSHCVHLGFVHSTFRLMLPRAYSGPRDGGIRTRWICSISPIQILIWLRNACFFVFVVWENFYEFSLYRNPDLDDRIFDCLLTSMAANFQQRNDFTDSPHVFFNVTRINRYKISNTYIFQSVLFYTL